ncbi:MAG TPA: type II secretion system protein N [Steroidobacter sp.]|nr:type II secretion system protein N [Steroidobacteraceae bacterium]HLS81820.1 type II secretion system protein N [Steroidobacter sp.]
MMRWKPLVLLGLAAFLLFAVITAPARIVVRWFAPEALQLDGVSGTIWNGRAEALAIQGGRIGAVQWKLHPLSLLTARLSADVKVTRVDGFLQTRATAAPGGRILFEDLTGSLPLAALPRSVAPGGWRGSLHLRLAQLALEDGWPLNAEGTVELVDLEQAARQPLAMGSYRVTFAENARSEDMLRGALADLGGPLELSGELQLRAQDRSYLIEGLAAARPDAPAQLANTLQFLGEPDAQGRRPISLAGTL